MNNYLIDTHVLLWYIEGNTRLAPKIISILDNSQNKIYVSKVSLWEIAIKAEKGKLQLTLSLKDLAEKGRQALNGILCESLKK